MVRVEAIGPASRAEHQRLAAVELYDHENDPLEMVNLANDPPMQNVRDSLHTMLQGQWGEALVPVATKPVEGSNALRNSSIVVERGMLNLTVRSREIVSAMHAQLFSPNGRLARQAFTRGGKSLKLATWDLPDGIYTLKVMHENRIDTVRVLIR